jgi:hypothetical protein
MLNENRHRLPGTGRAQVDVAAKQRKTQKIPESLPEHAKDVTTERKNTDAVLQSREEPAQTRTHQSTSDVGM